MYPEKLSFREDRSLACLFGEVKMSIDLRKDFPLLTHHPEMVYLDSAATVQKPSWVIDGVKHYLEHDYANIHRGRYDLSARSEELYRQARKKTAELIGGRDDEMIFTANSTSASNLLVQSMVLSGRIKAGDKILLAATSHHASLVPRQLVAKQIAIEIVRVGVTEDGFLDIDDFQQKYDDRVRVVSFPYVSNVIGQKDDFMTVRSLLRDETIFILDGSQAIAHLPVDIKQLGCDFLFFTGHKIFALTGIGVLRGKQQHLQALQPSMVGGGAIDTVTTDGYTLLDAPDKFEPGTPNLVGAVSLLKAIEYMERVGTKYKMEYGKRGKEEMNGQVVGAYDKLETPLDWRYAALHEIENPLVRFAVEQFETLVDDGVRLVGTQDPLQKIGLFSFFVPDGNTTGLGQYMAKYHVCIRCGGQCAQPLHEIFGHQGTCRISFSIYTAKADLERFFGLLKEWLANRP